jgi:hypothetical protein
MRQEVIDELDRVDVQSRSLDRLAHHGYYM